MLQICVTMGRMDKASYRGAWKYLRILFQCSKQGRIHDSISCVWAGAMMQAPYMAKKNPKVKRYQPTDGQSDL